MRSNNDRKKTLDFTFFYTQTQTLHRRPCRIRKTEDQVHVTYHDFFWKKELQRLKWTKLQSKRTYSKPMKLLKT